MKRYKSVEILSNFQNAKVPYIEDFLATVLV